MSAVLKTFVVLSMLPPVPPVLMASPQDEQSTTAQAEPAVSRFRAAQEAAQKGDFKWAEREYEQLMLEEPDNVDYLFGYAQTLFWANDVRRAVGFLEVARQLAPNYEAIWELEYRARLALTRGQSSPSVDRFRELAADRFPEADWHRRVAEPDSGEFRWEMSVSREVLDNDAPHWTRIDVRAGRQFAGGSLAMLSAARAGRFGTTDTQAAIDGALAVSDDWTLAGGVALSSEPNFLPETSVELAINRRFGKGWVGGVRWRRRDYFSASVESVALLTEYYFGRYRVAHSVETARLASERALVNAIMFNVYASSGARFGAVIAGGEEVELVRPGELLRTDVDSFAITGRHPIGDSLSIGWRVGTHRQGDFYRRNAIGLSLFGGL